MFAFYSFVYLNAHSVVIMPIVILLISFISSAAIASEQLEAQFQPLSHSELQNTVQLQPNQAIELLSEINTKSAFITGQDYQWTLIKRSDIAHYNNATLAFGFSRLPWLDIIAIQDGEIIARQEMDPFANFSERKIVAPLFYLPLQSWFLQAEAVLLRYQTFANATAALTIHEKQQLQQQIAQSLISNTALEGVIFAVLLMVFINFIFNRNNTNLYYCIWTALFLFIVLDMSRLTFQYLWPQHGLFACVFSLTLMTIAPVFHLLFINAFLQLKKHQTTLWQLYRLFCLLYVLLIPIAFYKQSVSYNLVLSLLVIPLLLVTAVWAWQQQAPGSKTFALSLINHVIFVNIIAIGSATWSGFGDVATITGAIKIGYFIEVMLFSLALAQQHNSVRNKLINTLQTKVNLLQQSVKTQKQFSKRSTQALQHTETRLFTDLSHELRTPLTVMKVQVESLQYNVVENVEASYDKLMAKIDELNGFINRLMLVADNQQLTTLLCLKRVCAEELSNNLYAQTVTIFPKGQKQFKLVVNNTPHTYVNVDLDYIANCVIEILSKAIKHGGEHISVTLSCLTTADKFIIAIEDKLTQVSYEAHKKLFSPLFNADLISSSGINKDTIGMAMCKKIIAVHDGIITSKDSRQGGLYIEIQLPLMRQSACA